MRPKSLRHRDFRLASGRTSRPSIRRQRPLRFRAFLGCAADRLRPSTGSALFKKRSAGVVRRANKKAAKGVRGLELQVYRYKRSGDSSVLVQEVRPNAQNLGFKGCFGLPARRIRMLSWRPSGTAAMFAGRPEAWRPAWAFFQILCGQHAGGGKRAAHEPAAHHGSTSSGKSSDFRVAPRREFLRLKTCRRDNARSQCFQFAGQADRNELNATVVRGEKRSPKHRGGTFRYPVARPHSVRIGWRHEFDNGRGAASDPVSGRRAKWNIVSGITGVLASRCDDFLHICAVLWKQTCGDRSD